jgi:hypothetical protein
MSHDDTPRGDRRFHRSEQDGAWYQGDASVSDDGPFTQMNRMETPRGSPNRFLSRQSADIPEASVGEDGGRGLVLARAYVWQ